MLKRIVSGIIFIMLLVAMFVFTFDIQLASAVEIIFIRTDGSIDPADAPISSVDNVTYTFTDNINSSIVVERNNVVVDGAGYIVQGAGYSGTGISLSGLSNVTLRETRVTGFWEGIYLYGSSNNSLVGNSVLDNYHGISLAESNNNILSSNNASLNLDIGFRCSGYNNTFSNNVISSNGGEGMYLSSASSGSLIVENIIAANYEGIQLCFNHNITVFHNDLINNGGNVYLYESFNNTWDNGYPSGGNYWSDYTGVDQFSGPDQNQTGSDGIGDTPHSIGDRYPLMHPKALNFTYIRSDGSVDPSTTPIQHVGETYTFTDNVYGSIVIERDNIVVDGTSHVLQGLFNAGTGMKLSDGSNVTIRNATIQNFKKGVELKNSTCCTIIESNIVHNKYGVITESLGEVTIEKNEISGNSEIGIMIIGTSSILIKENLIEGSKNGIATDESSTTHSGIIVVGNTILENSLNGVYLHSEGHLYSVTFSSNIVLANGYVGITVCSRGFGAGAWPMGQGHGYIRNVVFSSNTVSANNGDGIYLYSYGNGYYDSGYSYIYDVTLCSNTLLENSGNGVILYSESAGFGVPGSRSNYGNLSNIMFSSNTVLANNKNGVYLYSYGDTQGHLYNVTLPSNIVSANSENGVLAKARDHLTEFDLAMSNNTISSNHQKGIWIDGGINANLTRNSISYNTHGVFYSTSENNSARYNDVYGNSYGINVTAGATVNATYNYWGDASGPYHESLNVNGSGNPVNGNGTDLEFRPFLTTPIGEINERPVASLISDETLVTINQTVTFDASASTDDERIDYYFFDFGDGENSSWITSPVVVHNYTSRGIYNATITVMDDLGATSADGDLVNVSIRVVACPVANFTYLPEFPSLGMIVTFNASASYYLDGVIDNYRWDFGDGNTTIITDPVITHTFAATGTYVINLTVTSNDQFTAHMTKPLTTWNVSSSITLNISPTCMLIGCDLTMNGTITPPAVNADVTISYRRQSEAWATLATVKTDSDSKYTYKWETMYAYVPVGTYDFQANWMGSNGISPARSSVRTAVIYEHIYVRPDGSVYPPCLPIQRDGDLYTFMGDVFGGIVVEKDNIVIDGAGYILQVTFPNYYAGIDLTSRINITVTNLKVTGFDDGFRVTSSNGTTIVNNLISNSRYGIVSDKSSYNSLVGNNITHSQSFAALFIQSSSNNHLSGNNVMNNQWGIRFSFQSTNNTVYGNHIANNSHGISLDSSPNTVYGNNITNNDWGIWLDLSYGNVIYGNNISDNEYGIYISGHPSGNKIYHNNFIANSEQVKFWSPPGPNVWDDGYPSGGNYWRDYNGTDSDGDGIGDEPYVIDADNQDRYPLISPFIADLNSPTTFDDYDDFWHTTDFTINLTATDDLTGVAETYYKINDESTKTVTTDGQPLITTDGANNILEYWSVDNTGNEESHHVLTGIRLDKSYPTIETPSRTPEGEVSPDQSVEVSANVTDAVSGIENVTLYYTINDGVTWTDLRMNYSSSTKLYNAIVPQQEAGTLVRFKIVAHDNAGNNATLDGTEPYCVYQVIPEFSIPIIICLFMIITLAATLLSKRRKTLGTLL